MFSVALSVTEIGSKAFSHCYSLRNAVVPPNAVLADEIFLHKEFLQWQVRFLEGQSDELQRSYKKRNWTDLQQLFGSEERTVRELQHRFDRLPILKLVYYQ